MQDVDADAARAPTVITRPVLDYPYDLLDVETGIGPTNKDKAALLWQYREERPAPGVSETVEPDGIQMMKEIKRLRFSLQKHVQTKFWTHAKLTASLYGLRDPDTDQPPYNREDFHRCLGVLKRNEGSQKNEIRVYMTIHKFHHERDWIAQRVDEWCKANYINIVYPDRPTLNSNGKKARKCLTNRGGFGAWARCVKNALVKILMRNMLNHAGWCVSTKPNTKQCKDKNYEKVELLYSEVLPAIPCCIVTKKDSGTTAEVSTSSESGSSSVLAAASGSSTDPIMLDDYVVNFGTYMAKELFGQDDMSKERIQQMYQAFKPESRVLGLNLEIDSNNSSTAPGAQSVLTANTGPFHHTPPGADSPSASNEQHQQASVHSSAAPRDSLATTQQSTIPTADDSAAALSEQQPTSSRTTGSPETVEEQQQTPALSDAAPDEAANAAISDPQQETAAASDALPDEVANAAISDEQQETAAASDVMQASNEQPQRASVASRAPTGNLVAKVHTFHRFKLRCLVS